MATTHWRTGHTVADLFRLPDAGWQFHQLVRLMLPTGTSDDEILHALSERIQFVASQAMDFPPGAIRRVEMADELRSKNRVTCTDYNVAGLDAPLPEPFVDMLRDNQTFGDGAMAAFLDIFNSRIQGLRYLIHATTDNTLATADAVENACGKLMLAISGHLSEHKRALHQQQSPTLIGQAGMLANCRMSLPGIRQLFKVVMNLPLIAMESLIGRWLTVESSDHTLLGRANNRLGEQATLGKRIWDQQAAFGLRLGPLSAERIQQLVPGGDEHSTLRELLDWISDVRCDCKVTLVCEKDTGTEARLSRNNNQTNRLGYGAWLSGQKSEVLEVSFMLNLC